MRKLVTIIKFFLFTLVEWVFNLLALPVVPIAVMLADEEGRLPKFLRWFETPDALGWGAGTYEPAIKKVYDERGKRVALIMWLWRNRAYGLSSKWSARPNYDTMVMKSYGTQGVFRNAPAWWLGTITDGDKWWFEFSFAVRFGNLFVLGFRNGWKLLPFFDGHRPADFSTTATGLFTGISIRSDSVDGV